MAFRDARIAVFLDVGGVILDETDLEHAKGALITRIIASQTSYSIDRYWTDIEESVRGFIPSTYEYVLEKNLGPVGFAQAKKEFLSAMSDSGKLFKPMKGLHELVRRLSGGFGLGILGQYGREILSFLECEKILEFFSFRETQESYKITKPDPRYFEAVVAAAKREPQHCIMIGDRIDKDIIPAKQTGMKTVRVKSGIHKNQQPRTPLEVPDLTVASLDEITVERLHALFR